MTMRRPFVASLVVGFAVLSQPVIGQTRVASEIESRLKAKLEKPEFQTTAGMVEAYDEAVRAYRSEVSRVFEKLMRGLPKPQADSLATSHRAWLTYFEAMRVCVSYVSDADGSIHGPVAMNDLRQILQHRLEEMSQMFLESLEPEKGVEEAPDRDYWCRGPVHERLVTDRSDPLAPSRFELSVLKLSATKQSSRH